MIKKHKLVWLGLFLLVGQIFVTNFVSPPSAYAASVDELRSRGRRIVKLEAFRLCVNEYLTNDGIDPGDGPFNLDFAIGDSLHAADKAVGHGIDGTDGRWDCGSDTGNREDAWFKLVLRNGSNTEYYTGWDDGDNGYADYGSKNIRNVVGDDHPDLYFINSSNKADYDMDVEKDAVTGRAANKKLFAQIDRSIKKQEEGLTKDDKSAMRYIMLSDTFFSPTGCAAKEADPNDGGDKVKIGNVNYTVNNDGQGAGSGEVAVGHGDYAWGDRGTTNCKSLGEQMGKLRKAYETATGNTSQQPPGSNPDETDGAGDNGEIEFQCSVSINPLTWFMCPLITAFAGTVNALDGAINDRLLIDTDRYLDDKNSDIGNNFREVWVNVRNIALAILIIIGLIMVISTAIGVGPFDAYTVKKLMPRILMAIIGISLSWTFVKFAIDVTNSLGLAVRSLIQSPFKDVFEEGVKLDGGQLSLGSLGVVGVGMSLGIWGVLSLAGTAALAVMVAFAVLVIRQMLVILLAVLAPVAIVAYILPNTKKMGSLWWDFFSKALLTFPIISAFIAIGRVFAVVGRQVDDGLMGTFITFVAYFGPYFALPTAFRLAGGAIAQIGGMANDRSKGAFDRLSKFRQGKSQDRVKRFRAGGVYDKSTLRGRVGNQIGGMIFNPDEKVPYKLGEMGVPGFKGTYTRLGSEIEHKALEQSQKLSQEMQAAGFNDKALAAAAGTYGSLSQQSQLAIRAAQESGKLSKGAPKSVADYQELSHILSNSTSETEQIAGNVLHGAAGRLGNLHRDADMGYASVSAAAMFEKSRQGFADGEEIAQMANQTGDTAMGQAFATRAQLLGQAARPDLKAGYGVLFDKESGQFYSGVTGRSGKEEVDRRIDANPSDDNYRETVDNQAKRRAAAIKRSKDLVGTIKQQDIMGAKATMVKSLRDGFIGVATEKDEQGQLTERARAMQDTIMQNVSAFAGNDIDAKVEWRDIAAKVQADTNIDINGMAAANDAAIQEMRNRGQQVGGGGGGVPGAGPPPPSAPGSSGFGV